ncbi:MAG: hypothetical protein EOO22_01395 [Comamonadaceae bacterium]|nr:MAG: hypothetical protein EOO22_01395 [Comamonadaceae bacterium]
MALLAGFEPPAAMQRLWVYDMANRSMHEITARSDEALAALRADARLPLEANFQVRGAWLDWSLGPELSGSYFIASPTLGRIPVARVGSTRLTVLPVGFHVQHATPSGVLTRSDDLTLQSGQTELRWRRP